MANEETIRNEDI